MRLSSCISYLIGRRVDITSMMVSSGSWIIVSDNLLSIDTDVSGFTSTR